MDSRQVYHTHNWENCNIRKLDLHETAINLENKEKVAAVHSELRCSYYCSYLLHCDLIISMFLSSMQKR